MSASMMLEGNFTNTSQHSTKRTGSTKMNGGRTWLGHGKNKHPDSSLLAFAAVMHSGVYSFVHHVQPREQRGERPLEGLDVELEIKYRVFAHQLVCSIISIMYISFAWGSFRMAFVRFCVGQNDDNHPRYPQQPKHALEPGPLRWCTPSRIQGRSRVVWRLQAQIIFVKFLIMQGTHGSVHVIH